ncbi:MAG: LCP family protein [Patescibacteria group bacterium]|nr:LCP family protein [Patescibacteria group bacterium]
MTKYLDEQTVPVRQVTKSKSNAPDFSTKKPKKNRKTGKPLKAFAVFFIFLITIISVFSHQITSSEQGSNSWLSNLPLLKQFKSLAESAERGLKGETDNRINILLLGMGGIRHEGGYLTDTIMLGSLEPKTKKAALTSIPRDLAVPLENIGSQKINSINAYAEMEAKGSGGLAVSQAVGDIIKQPVDYFVRVDFEGFINIVDILDGIDIYVDNTLDDYRYPVQGREEAEDYESRFEHLHINSGWQHMKGELALKYARSRHALGIEGSDFARARRQQKVIAAVKDKLLSRSTLLKPGKIMDIYQELNEHIATNLQIWEMIKLWDLFKDISSNDIVMRVLDNSPNGLLVDRINEQGAYVLVPRSGDFAEIQYFIDNVFSDVPVEISNVVKEENTTIEVRNGTWVNGLASQMALDLEKLGFSVLRVGNSSHQNFETSVVYDLSYGEKNKSLKVLRKHFDANVAFDLPGWLVSDIAKELEQEYDPVQPDFILILGHDADKSDSGKVNTEEN